ncbi:MAG: hypothetical protein AVDCRST_MAG67-1598 [uncultured Solirubrobacteraceae bacterium]|uniref:Methyltransferase domain-containing protein n=1 Tax=uncultured Solirubrobacteraceae bacterium TaxID=1162706 RepID=A0A6J4SBP3_9ACTN|nr:MAG: hypothetical protein AVDCRST_MAG67-1598 [uncultured Solirubrobacteraceae bacterium]
MHIESPATHFERADVVAEYGSFDFLLAPEEDLLREHASELPRWRMLDVGVGAGRTSAHLMERVREYVGIDCSAAMVQRCHERFAGRMPVTASFRQADVRTLVDFDEGSFDFVLFSFNGLDTVGDGSERAQALRAIARVCAPGALFCFSAHNLLWFRRSISPLRAAAGALPAARRHPRAPLRAAREALHRRRLNAPGGGRGEERVIIEERPRYELARTFYQAPDERILISRYTTTPKRQEERLVAAGFRDLRILDLRGNAVAAADERSQWLHYVCRRAGDDR